VISPNDTRLRTSVVLPFAIGVVALLFLVERTTALQVKATEASERLRGRADTILAHVADAVFVTDGDGRLILSNAAAERLVGQPSDQTGGMPCHLAFGLHRGERTLDCSQGCAIVLAQRDDPTTGHELWRHDASGRRQPLLASAAPVVARDGQLEVIHSLRDITRLKQAEEAKTLFLATASHELKTPLTVISGFASTLMRFPDLDDETRASGLKAIHTRAAELTRIVERLLLSSRIEAGHVEFDLEPLLLPDLLRERVAACAAGIGRTISFTSEEGVPPVIANAEALTTVVDHLLDNAIKYSPNGEAIEVGLSSLEEVVQIAVADHGIGMDPEQAQHCFDRFWQAESTDVRRFGGTGIGLYIVQSLVEAMRGTIHVESAPAAGSTFLLRLARADAPPPRAQPGVGEATSIREFMRQIGVPERTRP
jgi:PAS domain S-box-containing protein